MKPYQFIGYTLNQTSAITAITSTRITHGNRPIGEVLPAINYYKIGGERLKGIDRDIFSINCRSESSAEASDLARLVIELFQGSSGTGIYGTMNGFDVGRISLQNIGGLISEPDSDCYNAPVDVAIIYPINTVT